MKLDNDYWSNRYNNNTATWDVGKITPPLQAYFDQLTNKNMAILIPGCGNSYEAEYLLQNGFTNITLIDISSVLCKVLAEKFATYFQKELHIICADFFELKGQYDLIIEQTFFCALNPSLRNNYAVKMQQLLKPGGKLAGLLFNRDFEGGPPFGGHENEYRRLFQPLFIIEKMEKCNDSLPQRMGSELMIALVNNIIV